MKEGIYLIDGNVYMAKNTSTGSRVYLIMGIHTKDITFKVFHESDAELREIEITNLFKDSKKSRKLGSLEAIFDLFV